MYRLFILMLFFASSSLLNAQTLEIPNDPALETPKDYKELEGLILKSIDWCQNTPLKDFKHERKNINGFIVKWITGSPTVTIDLHPDFFAKDCPECLMSFMSGWLKYSLENDYSSSKKECTLAGIEMAIEFYQNNKRELGKNSDMKKFIRLQKKGKLKMYIDSKIE